MGAYPDHGEEAASGTENGLGGRNSGGFLCDVKIPDERLQCRKSTIEPFRLGGVRCHR